MTSQLQSVGDWLKMAVQRLRAVSGSPQLDAEILLQSISGIHRAMAFARPESLLTREQLEDLEFVLARREDGEPIAYITGQQEFWSMALEVSPAVLIPRPETELLVERALEIIPLNEPSRVLDLGTGSGAIALAIAQARPHSIVMGVDVSPAALTVAGRNRRKIGVANLNLKHSDWFAALAGERFDVIVSNPPYVGEQDPDLSPTVAAFEPRVALISGASGMQAIEKIAADAPSHLLPGGWLLCEHGWKQAPLVRAALVQHGFSHVRSRTDLAGNERVSEGKGIMAGA